MPSLDLILLILLSALWGASYLFIRIAGPALGPIALMAIRLVVAGGLLAALARSIGQAPDFRACWRRFLVIGAIGNAVPFVLIANAVIHLNASIAAILNATVPLFTVVVSTLWLREPLGLRKMAGAGLGIVGVSALVGWSPLPVTPTVLLATAQALLAALSYALTAVYARRRFADLSPLQAAVGQVCGGAVLLTPLIFVVPPQAPLTWPIGLSVLALAVPCTVLAYCIYFRLIASAGPTMTSTVTFLIPVFGILWAAMFLGEPVNLGVLAGLGVILLSVWLVLGKARRRPGRGRQASALSGRQTARGNAGPGCRAARHPQD
jgi:drug/metabolite transporter (DMT)-like permease